MTKVARAEIPEREWVQLKAEIQGGKVQSMTFSAFGCHNLLDAATAFTKLAPSQELEALDWEGASHWDLLIREAILKLQGRFDFPYKEEELCHCRKVPAAKVDNAIVLGAQTPEKVRAWTTASSGCGTCRPNVETLISFRLRKSS